MEPVKSYLSNLVKSVVKFFDIDEGSTARFNTNKQSILDLMDQIERTSPIIRGELVQLRPAFELPPELYAIKKPQELETRINSVNVFYALI